MQYTQKFQKREKKMKEFESLKTVLNKKVLTVVFNRPNEMNTFSGQMLKDILELLDEAEKDDDIRAVIFTGSGKAFCAGADLSSGEDTFDMSDKGKSDAEVKRDTGGILTLRLFDFKKPLIAAAINGFLKSNNLKVSIPPVSLFTSASDLPLSDISNVSSPDDRSAPAQKAFPEPVKITARMSSSFSASSRSSRMSFNI